MAKVDHLRLCNEHGIPFQDFEASFCQRCVQPECTRSQHGKTKFEARVGAWEERLFLKVLKMDPKDERFPTISGQKFLSIGGGSGRSGGSGGGSSGSPAGGSAWIDPKDLEPTKTISIPAPVVEEPPPPPTASVEAPKAMEPQPSGAAPEAPLRTVSPQVLSNTPNRPKQMIGGAEQKPSSPVLDPWQPKQPLKPGEQLVKPGARVKLS